MKNDAIFSGFVYSISKLRPQSELSKIICQYYKRHLLNWLMKYIESGINSLIDWALWLNFQAGLNEADTTRKLQALLKLRHDNIVSKSATIFVIVFVLKQTFLIW